MVRMCGIGSVDNRRRNSPVETDRRSRNANNNGKTAQRRQMHCNSAA